MGRRLVVDLPVGVAPEDAAARAPGAEVDPANLAALDKREPDADVGVLRLALDARPGLRLGFIPVLDAVAHEMLCATRRAGSPRRSLVPVGLELEPLAAAGAARQPKRLDPVAVLGECLEVRLEVLRFAADPPRAAIVVVTTPSCPPPILVRSPARSPSA